MKIIFLGTPDYVDPIIQTLDENFELVKVIRSSSDSFDSFDSLQPDLLVVASFGKIIPQSILEIPKFGAINIHPSLLPKYRGPSPLQNQILDGVTDSAISFILMDSEMDHGPILKQVPFQISENDTFQSLCEKMFAESAKYISEVVQSLADGSIQKTAQNEEDATVTKLVEKEDGYFDIDNPPAPEKLQKMIRAYYPWPGTWTKWNGKIVKFLPNPSVIAKRDREGVIARPRSGEAISESESNKSISTGIASEKAPRNDAPFLVQMEGKKATDFKSFLNGYPDFPLKSI